MTDRDQGRQALELFQRLSRQGRILGGAAARDAAVPSASAQAAADIVDALAALYDAVNRDYQQQISEGQIARATQTKTLMDQISAVLIYISGAIVDYLDNLQTPGDLAAIQSIDQLLKQKTSDLRKGIGTLADTSSLLDMLTSVVKAVKD